MGPHKEQIMHHKSWIQIRIQVQWVHKSESRIALIFGPMAELRIFSVGPFMRKDQQKLIISFLHSFIFTKSSWNHNQVYRNRESIDLSSLKILQTGTHQFLVTLSKQHTHRMPFPSDQTRIRGTRERRRNRYCSYLETETGRDNRKNFILMFFFEILWETKPSNKCHFNAWFRRPWASRSVPYMLSCSWYHLPPTPMFTSFIMNWIKT